MGNALSGRYETTPKTENALDLNVVRLHRLGILEAGSHTTLSWTRSRRQVGSVTLATAEDALWLAFTSDGTARKQRVPIERTPCHYGGARAWFRCPTCGRRVGVLYFATGFFVCRECGGLRYASRSLRPRDRWLRRSRKLRERLGGGPSIQSDIPRPKWMHRATYERQVDLIRGCEHAVLWSAYHRLEELKRRNANAQTINS